MPQLLGHYNRQPLKSGEFRLSQAPEELERREEQTSSGERVWRVIGLDLGQAHDPAAAALIRWHTYSPRFEGPRWPYLEVAKLKLWPRGYDYTELVPDVLGRWADAVVYDMGGVGRPFRNMLCKEATKLGYRGKLLPVNLVSSDARVKDHADAFGKFVSVPKVEIVSAVNIVRQTKVVTGRCERCKGTGELEAGTVSVGCPSCRLLRVEEHPLVSQLMQELSSFKIKRTAAKNLTFDHSGPGHHGDLVIALGLATWYYLRGQRELALNT